MAAYGQRQNPYEQIVRVGYERNGRDSMLVIELKPVVKFARTKDMRRYDRLARDVKKVYPVAREANSILKKMEGNLQNMDKRQQRVYLAAMEKAIKEKYTPVLRHMTFSQGKILVKLIDRETSRTSYQLLKEFRGSFSAFLWQGVARLFGANLKDEYDAEGDDKMIEDLIRLYDAGLL